MRRRCSSLLESVGAFLGMGAPARRVRWKVVFKKDITCGLVTKYVEYELAVHRRVQAAIESIADSPNDAESPVQHVMHGPGGVEARNLEEKDGSEASGATLVEIRHGVKRSLPADGLEEAELQRPVKLKRLTV